MDFCAFNIDLEMQNIYTRRHMKMSLRNGICERLVSGKDLMIDNTC